MKDLDSPLRARARELGVQTSYHDVMDELHHADDVALERIVAALEADQADAAATSGIGPALHIGLDRPVVVPGRISQASLLVAGHSLDLATQQGDREDRVGLPADLPFGCHLLEVESDRGSGRTIVVVAPSTMPRSETYARTAGLFVPTYALWETDTPLPSFTHLHQLARRLKASGIDVVSTLPLYATFLDDPFDPSPYSPISRMHWNEVYIDDAVLPAAPVPPLGNLVDWRALAARRRTQLIEAARTLDDEQVVRLQAFVTEHPDVIDYARFRARLEADGDPVVERSHVLAQYLADQQLSAIAGDPAAAALALDLPVGSNPDGFEAWASAPLFAQGMNVGAPPDAFFSDGQDWGFRPPLPAAGHASGHELWRDLIGRVGRHADILRIDHAMAVERLWWVPQGLPAQQGAYVHYPREEILAVIAASAAAAGVTIVGEDLGTVPPEVAEAFDRWDVLGMYEEQFHLETDPLPHIPWRSVAGIRTHDMAPLAEAVVELDTAGYRDRVGAAHDRVVGDTWQDILDQMLIRLSYSDAYSVIADLDDLVGETRPHNLPGRVVPEIWRRRLDLPTSELLADHEVSRRLDLLRSDRGGAGNGDGDGDGDAQQSARSASEVRIVDPFPLQEHAMTDDHDSDDDLGTNDSHDVATTDDMTDGFRALGLRDELLAALDDLGYEEPTPIQRETIPLLLTGCDLLGQAATGTGKTAAFALPALQLIDASRRKPQVLVLVPTRELAVQVSEAMFRYGSELGVKVVPIFGGQPIQRQLQALDRGVHVVVATPGRALDHIGRGSLALDSIRTVILDEADEMLDMGFTDDIESILESTPADRQTVLFSATMPSRITSIAKRYQRNPQRITIGRADAEPGAKVLVRQTVYVVQRAHKPSALGRILDIEAPKSALVFCRTRTEVDQLTSTMNARGYRAEALHGGMDQAQRDRVMARLRDGTAELLVATDVAARGLDVDTLTHVVNYDVPSAAESYVHRIGRVGRAGREGVAITLAEPRERRGLENIERLTKQKFEIAKVPTVSDLRERQIELTVIAVREALTSGDLEDFNAVLHALADDNSDRNIALAAIKLVHESRGATIDELEIPDASDRLRGGKQGGEGKGKGKKFDGKNRNAGERDRGAKGKTAGAGTGFVHVSLGRKAGVRPGDLVGAIANETGLVGRDIGPIRISEAFSVVGVPEASVEHVIETMKSTTMRGKRAKVRRFVD